MQKLVLLLLVPLMLTACFEEDDKSAPVPQERPNRNEERNERRDPAPESAPATQAPSQEESAPAPTAVVDTPAAPDQVTAPDIVTEPAPENPPTSFALPEVPSTSVEAIEPNPVEPSIDREVIEQVTPPVPVQAGGTASGGISAVAPGGLGQVIFEEDTTAGQDSLSRPEDLEPQSFPLASLVEESIAAGPSPCAGIEAGDFCSADIIFVGEQQSLALEGYDLMTTIDACDWDGNCLQPEEAVMLSWENALNYCENLIWGGFEDWTLPTVNELSSLYCLSGVTPVQSLWQWLTGQYTEAAEYCAGVAQSPYLRGLIADWYWSIEDVEIQEEGDLRQAPRSRRFSFDNGESVDHLKSHRSQVRCVRRAGL